MGGQWTLCLRFSLISRRTTQSTRLAQAASPPCRVHNNFVSLFFRRCGGVPRESVWLRTVRRVYTHAKTHTNCSIAARFGALLVVVEVKLKAVWCVLLPRAVRARPVSQRGPSMCVCVSVCSMFARRAQHRYKTRLRSLTHTHTHRRIPLHMHNNAAYTPERRSDDGRLR